MDKFAIRLKELRKEKGLTLEQVEKDTGILNGTLSRYELGQREPKVKYVKMLADYFDVSLDYILGYSNKKKQP